MARQPRAGQDLTQVLRDMRSHQRQTFAGSVLIGSGLGVAGPNTNVVSGDLQSSEYVPGVAGYAISAAGDAEFEQLTARSGTITPSTLTSLDAPGVIWAAASGFAIPAGPTETIVLSVTLTVPASVTSAALTVTGRVYAVNTTATAEYLTALVSINGLPAAALPVPAEPAAAALNPVIGAAAITGLSTGATIAVHVWAHTTSGWDAHTSNLAELAGLVVWHR